SKGAVRVAAALLIGTVLLASPAFAESRHRGERGALHYFERAKSFIISLLGRIGGPPGDAEPEVAPAPVPEEGGS
ncbi:MAG TPA: hypothetical protein VF111_13190, partial [Thermoanaerobaculia bacterium]